MRKMSKFASKKTSLTFEEKITAAWAYHVKGIDQHTIAAMYSVNGGRIAEACKAVELALQETKPTDGGKHERGDEKDDKD